MKVYCGQQFHCPCDDTDVSTPGGALFSETLNGFKSVAVSGDGIFLDEAAQEGRPLVSAGQKACLFVRTTE